MEKPIKVNQLPKITGKFHGYVVGVNPENQETVIWPIGIIFDNDFSVLSEVINRLKSKVESLSSSRETFGDASCNSIDIFDKLKICGNDAVIINESSPNIAPNHISQVWIQTSADNKHVWMATGVEGILDWTQLV